MALLAALVLWSLLPFLFLFVPALGAPSGADRGMFTGSDGLQVPDHLQYLAWIRDAGDHALFSNRFDVVDDPHLFLHPLFALSGLAWRLGVPLQVALIAWKVVGVAALFAGFTLYVRRMVPEGGATRAAALALALFLFTPATSVTDWLGHRYQVIGFGTLVIGFELFPAGVVFGGAPSGITLGLMALFLLGVERMLKAESGGWRGRVAAGTALAGLFAAWLHPWQGLTLLGILGGLWAWARFDRRYLVLAGPAAATLAPIVYYVLLSRTDSSWAHVSEPATLPHLGNWLYITLGPCLLVAALGLRRPGKDVQERILLLWPLVAVILYFALDRSFFYHALTGLSLPFAVLSVRAAQRVRLPRPAAVAAVAALTVPGMILFVDLLRDDAPNHFLTKDETTAMDYLESSPTPGPVLSTPEFGVAVPAFAGRNTWVGHHTWTPGYNERVGRSRDLFDGRLDSVQAQELVRSTGARFAVSDCRHDADLTGALRPLIVAVRHFGCADVYELRRSG
jgi:hypothetical protein